MDDLSLARSAAHSGGEVVVSWYRRVHHADFKGEVDPVTEADREAERAILDLLRTHRSQDRVLAEEGGESGQLGGRRWLVDPLDGTVNFVHGIPHVAVSVALEDESGLSEAVVLDPFRNEEFVATRGGGAFLNGERVAVSGRTQLGRAMVATGFPYDRRQHGPAYAATVGAVLQQVRGVRRMGTAALDLAWLAAGRYDAFWEFGLKPWDIAAGTLLVHEAGGRVTDAAGESVRAEEVVASNGALHEPFRVLIAANMPEHLARHS